MFETLHALTVVNPDAKGEDFVNPVFQVVFFVIFTGDGSALGETARALVLVCRNMNGRGELLRSIAS